MSFRALITHNVDFCVCVCVLCVFHFDTWSLVLFYSILFIHSSSHHNIYFSYDFSFVAFTDSGKYLSKYSSFMECNHDQCAIDKLREHFHCLDILCMNVNKVLCKREEVLRHLKWHKKRNESLTHGFLRFSSTDDCSIQFGECQHNGKQTHYHCLQGNCDKVYISTSDVQMHSNYHRKDSAIMQEGWVIPFTLAKPQ